MNVNTLIAMKLMQCSQALEARLQAESNVLNPEDQRERFAAALDCHVRVMRGYRFRWLADTMVRCTSDEGYAVCREILSSDLECDLSKMLRNFGSRAQSTWLRASTMREMVEAFFSESPDTDVFASFYQGALEPWLTILSAMTQASPISGLLLMAGLEHTAAIYLPALRERSAVLGLPNDPYLQFLENTASSRATRFTWALEAEVGDGVGHLEHLKNDTCLLYLKDVLMGTLGPT